MRAFASTLLSASLLLLSSSLAARDETPNEQVEVSLELHKIITEPNGAVRRVKAVQVAPGDIVEYRATYRNRGDKTVNQVKAVLPIPVGMKLVARTAKPLPRYASLGGPHEALPLKRKVTRSDGTTAEQEVPEHEFRSLQWRFTELPPGSSITVSIHARLNPIEIIALPR